MTPNDWERLKPLFEQALALPPMERAAFVEKIRGEDDELARHLGDLLAGEVETGALDEPLAPFEALTETETRFFSPDELLLGRFRIRRFLGQGGMGEVYEAEDLQLGPVALKTIRPEKAGPDSLARFRKEVMLARRVTNPHVCRIYDLFTVPRNGRRPEIMFFTMELLPGFTLAHRLAESGPLPLDDAEGLALQLCAALEAIHSAGVIHRDFKSNNVMLVPRPGGKTQAVVMDLGLARDADGKGHETLTMPGAVMGTPEYMAPEQFRAGEITVATDVYALGIVLYEIVTGERPFRSSTPLAAAVLRGKRLSKVSSVRPEVDQRWDDIIARCLEFEPAARFASAADVALAFTQPPPELPGASLAVAHSSRPGLASRRVLLGFGLGGMAVLTAAWLRWPEIDSAMHPLPQKRFVALMIWPDAAESLRPVLNSVLDAIARRLARAESVVHDLLVIRPSDVPGPGAEQPKEAVYLLGANLVLAASMQRSGGKLTLLLRILDAVAGGVLRERRISAPAKSQNALPQKASIAALALLQVPDATGGRSNDNPAAHVNPAAWEAYISAEDLMRQPNDSRLNDAIAKYQNALEADPGFGLTYARLTIAYLRKYQQKKEPATLRLAERNSEHAVQIAPDSPQTIFAAAQVDLFNGRTEQAMEKLARAAAADPGNSDILMYQALAFRDLDRASDEEALYRMILKQRPNFWPAYNDLGAFLYRHGRLQEALEAFEEASAVAPSAALPLTNAGTILLVMRRKDEAVEFFQKSLRAAPNERAFINLGNIAFEDRAYDRALDYYQQAHNVNPRSHEIFRDIGDCYQVTGKPQKMVESYVRASDLLQDQLRNNPRSGSNWMRLAFYDAKARRLDRVAADISAAEARGATDVPSQFMKAQALAVTGHKDQAVQLVLRCLDRGMSPVEVDVAPDLKEVRSDARYKSRIAARAKGESGKSDR